MADITSGQDVDIITALPAGANAIGKLAANSGVDIGDVDILSSALPTGAATSANQILGKTIVKKTIDFTASQTAQTIWDPTAGKKFVITDYDLSFSAAGAITVFDETDNTTLRVFKINGAVNGGAIHAYTKPYESATADNVLKYTTGAGAIGSLTLIGYEI